jgi:hypothetical protein
VVAAPPRLRAFGWALLCIALAVTIYRVTRVRRDLVDFEVYRTAAVRAASAEPLYRPEDGRYQFKYLPAFALLVAPAAWGNPETAKAIWFALGCGLVMFLFTRSADLLPDRRHSAGRLIAVTAVVTAKLWIKELVEGQTNLWLAGLVVGALGAADRRRPVAAGCLIGAAVFVKPYAIIFVPWLALATGLSGLLAFAATAAVGLALPAVVYGWHGDVALHLGWWRTVSETTTATLLLAENVSIASMWAKWIGIGPMAAGLAMLTSGGLFAAALSMFARRRYVHRPSYLEVAALLGLIPLLSPQGWDYVLLLGIPATMALIDRSPEVDPIWRLAATVAIVVTGFTLFDVLGRATYVRAMSISVLTLAAITLTACVVHLRWRRLA